MAVRGKKKTVCVCLQLYGLTVQQIKSSEQERDMQCKLQNTQKDAKSLNLKER
jgi:membrane protein insertase Oxa1/YidC/SpoIIIJ